MPHSRAVNAYTKLAARQVNPGFSVAGLRPDASLTLDPFLSIDAFHMSQATFPPHPHAGFSAVTYMLPESPGAFTNRDSMGDRRRIAPGALHWTQAGRGLMHEEIPEHPGTQCVGLQIFVNLRAQDKLSPPAALHLENEDVPVVSRPGVQVRVLAGEFGGASSPLNESLLTRVLLLHVLLEPNGEVAIPIEAGHTGFALALKGEGAIGPREASQTLTTYAAAGLATDGDEIELRAGATGLAVVVGGGAPLQEPLVFGGPFAMNTEEQIQDCYDRFRRGEMGRLLPST